MKNDGSSVVVTSCELRRRGRAVAAAVICLPVGPLIVVATQGCAHRSGVPDNNPNQEAL